MATTFDPNEYLKSRFKVEKTPEAIRATAEGILANKDFWGSIGNQSALGWASSALSRLNDYEARMSGTDKLNKRYNNRGEDLAARDLDLAYSWINGSAQSHAAKNVLAHYDAAQRDISKKITNESSNLQNTPERSTSRMDSFSPTATLLGLDPKAVAAQTTKTASGDFIPTANLTPDQRKLAAAERQAAIERAAGISTNVAGGSQATPQNTAAPTQPTVATGERLLGPTEYANLRTQLGVSDKNFDQYFRRDASGNIYLKAQTGSAPYSAGSVPETPSASDISTKGSSIFGDNLSSNLESGASAPDAFVASLKSLDALFSNPAIEGYKATETSLTSSLRSDMKLAEGKGAATLAAEDAAGISAKTKQLEDLNLRIAQKIGQYDAGNAAIMDQAIPQDLLVGQSAALKRQQAVDVGILYMQAAALKDNITLAKDLADQAVNLHFQDIETRIKNTATMLSLNSDQMSAEEKRLASKVEILLEERQRQLDDQKAEKKANTDLMISIIQAGGDASNVDFNASYEENARRNADVLKNVGGATSDITEYNLARSQGFAGSFMDFTRAMKLAGSSGSSTSSTSAANYAAGVKNGTLSLSDVPIGMRDDVSAILSQDTTYTSQNAVQDSLDALKTITDLKDSGYTREDVEKMYKDAGAEIPQSVSTSLDQVYGASGSGWWDKVGGFFSSLFGGTTTSSNPS